MKKLFVGILCLLGVFLSKGQTDDLMIVEYVDWASGTGVGIKIFNPTNETIDLSNYTLATYHNGNTTPATSGDLSGSLASNQSKMYGNGAYCGSCSNSCNTLTINGVNGNDAVVLLNGITIIDMVGPLGADTDLMIAGISNALDEKKLTRNSDNCIRYTDLAGTTLNSWPDNDQTNVSTWQVFDPPSCLTQSQFSIDLPVINRPPDTTICREDSSFETIRDIITDMMNVVDLGVWGASSFLTDSNTIIIEGWIGLCYAEPVEVKLYYEDCEPIVKNIIQEGLIYIPNIITPNNDGVNDFFVINGIDEEIRLTVFNRWGRQIYQVLPYQNDWQAEGLNDGSYYYLVEQGFVQIKGWVEVKR